MVNAKQPHRTGATTGFPQISFPDEAPILEIQAPNEKRTILAALFPPKSGKSRLGQMLRARPDPWGSARPLGEAVDPNLRPVVIGGLKALSSLYQHEQTISITFVTDELRVHIDLKDALYR